MRPAVLHELGTVPAENVPARPMHARAAGNKKDGDRPQGKRGCGVKGHMGGAEDFGWELSPKESRRSGVFIVAGLDKAAGRPLILAYNGQG